MKTTLFAYEISDWKVTRVMSDVWDDERIVSVYDVETREFSKVYEYAGLGCLKEYGKIEDAYEQGLVSREQFESDYKAMKEEEARVIEEKNKLMFATEIKEICVNEDKYKSIKYLAREHKKEFNIPCEIERSRKYKGMAVFVKARANSYGTLSAEIMIPGQKLIDVSFNCIKFSQSTLDVIAKLITERRGDSYNAVDVFLNKVVPFIGEGVSSNAEDNTSSTISANKHKEWLQSKRDSLRAWVDEKFADKTDEEREKITHCIMIKRNGEDIY